MNSYTPVRLETPEVQCIYEVARRRKARTNNKRKSLSIASATVPIHQEFLI